MDQSNRKYNKHFNNKHIVSAVNRLYANIKFVGVEQTLKSIAIVSPNKHEGKTTVATNLAATIASNGNSVLLIDADIYQQSIANLFSKDTEHNITNYIRGEVNLEQVINKTYTENLYFLDCATHIRSIADLVSYKGFDEFYAMLRDSFDYIIFDTPPILPCVDSIIVGSICDGAVVVARENKTTVDSLQSAMSQLNNAHINTIGCVLTFSKNHKKKYYYGY